MWSGTSVVGTANTLRDEIIRDVRNDDGQDTTGWTITKFIKGETWTEDLYFHITAQHGGAGSSVSVFENMTIVGV